MLGMGRFLDARGKESRMVGAAKSQPSIAVALLVALGFCMGSRAIGDAKMFDYPEQLERLRLDKAGSKDWSVVVREISPPGGVAYPNETVSLELVLRNGGDAPIAGAPVVEVVRIGAKLERVEPERGDPMAGGQVISTVPLSEPVRVPMPELKVAPKGEERLRWQQEKAGDFAEFGAYAVIVELPKRGRQAAATFVRVRAPNPAAGDGRNSPLIYHLHPAFDLDKQLEAVRRLGYKWVRTDGMPSWASVSSNDVSAPFEWAKTDAWVDAFRKRGLSILSNMYGSPPQTVTNANWQAGNRVHEPQHDKRFGDFVEEAVARYCGADGKGPLRIIDFWDEPWEGGGTSGWKSDSVRYRQLYKILYERAHKASRHIVVGGTSSIMNTLDKFFSARDGEQEWGGRLDVLTDRDVQPCCCFGPRLALKLAIPSIETETWLGSSPEMLVAAATHLTAAGQRKVNPSHPTQLLWENGPAGPMAGPTASAASFLLHFLAGMDFERIVFHDRLPWLYQWGVGERAAFVLAGDRQRLNPNAVTMYDQIRADGTITLDDMEGKLKAYDLYGNPHKATDDRKYRLPCSAASVYLDAPGVRAEMVVGTIGVGRIEGVPPVEFFVDDFVLPIEKVKTLDFEVHNVLDRQIHGTIRIKPPGVLGLQESAVSVTLGAGATKTLRVPIISAKAHPSNAYPFTFRFEGAAGNTEWTERLHVNTIAYGRATVDGDLTEWKGAIPAIVHTRDVVMDLAEAGWRPWETRADITKGLAEVRFMWDEKNLYLAVRERNKDWKPKPRLSTRNDDEYFGKGDMAHTYVKDMRDALPYTGDCFQLGIRFASLRTKLPPHGAVPQRMLADEDTDYEYALWGAPDGGAEIWRNNAPYLVFLNFLPRCMPEGYDGVPKGAQAVVKRLGSDTTYEAAIPLADMQGLVPAPGKVIHLTFVMPGSGIQLGAGRSRCRANGLTLKPTWAAHPSNDVRWGFIRE
jgi:hypothetical protein